MEIKRVSIIIPVCNRWDLTRACIESVYRFTPRQLFEILVMDNGSTDPTRSELPRLFPAVKYLREETPLSFSSANNRAVKSAAGNALCFLNNDTLVTERWLEPLLETLCSSVPLAAAVGPKLLYPDGSVQEAGIVFSSSGLPYHYGRFLDRNHPAVNVPRECNSLTGACIVCWKHFFEQEGGFSERYINGFEDTDLCLRWRRRNLSLRYEPRSTVYHLESQTPRRSDHDKQNTHLFVNEWRAEIAQDDLPVYARLRGPELMRDLIGVIIRAESDSEQLQKALRLVFSFSSCAVSILIVGPGKEITPSLANLENAIIRCTPVLDRVAITGWIETLKGHPRFRGLLYLGSPCFAPESWDIIALGSSDRGAALTGVTATTSGFASAVRYLSNLPDELLVGKDFSARNACLKTWFRDYNIFCKGAGDQCLFFPSGIVDSLMFAESVASGDLSGRHVSLVSPVFAFACPEPVAREFPGATVIVHAALPDPGTLATVNSVLGSSSPAEVELLIACDTPVSLDSGAVQGCLATRRTALLSPRATSGATVSWMRAIQTSASEYLVFVNSGDILAPDWVDRALVALEADSLLPGIRFDPVNKTPDRSCLAVRRADFRKACGSSGSPECALETLRALIAEMRSPG